MVKQVLTRANRELFRRPADESFGNFSDLYNHCRQMDEQSTERWIQPSELTPVPSEGSLAIEVARQSTFKLNAWSFGQLCTFAGVSRETVNRLTPDTASMVFYETLPRGNKPIQVYENSSTIRSVHPASYTRLTNIELLSTIREFATDFVPPQRAGRSQPDESTQEGGTGLYCGEQDLFVFLIDSITLVQTRTTAQSEAMLKTFVDSIGSNTPRGLLNRAVLRPPVVVLSPTAERARGSLPEHGISDATTVHSFLNSLAQKTNAFTAGIIWVEDANKLATRDLLAVAEQSRTLGSRLFLAGDPTMNSAWTKGNGMSLLRDHAGLDGVKVHENTRQKSLLRDVTNSFARGQIENGFRGLDQLDAMKETEPKNLARLSAEQYVHRTKAGESVSLLGGNRDEVKELNKQARDTLKSDGQLKKSKTFQQLVPTDSSEADRRRSDFYEAGQVVQFGKHAAGFKAGSRWNVVGHDPFKNVAVTDGSCLKSLPLSKADRFQVYNPQTIEVSIGEKLRITRGAMVYSVSETVFNQFRQRPDFPTHEIHSGAEYKVKRFTRDGRIQLDNNFVLDKTFGHIDYGYARTAASATRKPDDHVILRCCGVRSARCSPVPPR